jgi:hypothetical protein
MHDNSCPDMCSSHVMLLSPPHTPALGFRHRPSHFVNVEAQSCTVIGISTALTIRVCQVPPDVKCGVGIELVEFDGALIVQKVYVGGPAERYVHAPSSFRFREEEKDKTGHTAHKIENALACVRL